MPASAATRSISQSVNPVSANNRAAVSTIDCRRCDRLSEATQSVSVDLLLARLSKPRIPIESSQRANIIEMRMTDRSVIIIGGLRLVVSLKVPRSRQNSRKHHVNGIVDRRITRVAGVFSPGALDLGRGGTGGMQPSCRWLPKG